MRSVATWLYLALTLALLTAGRARAATPPVAEVGARIDLGPVMEVLEDPTTTLGWDDVRRPEIAARFVPNAAPTLRRGVTRSAFWLHARVRNPSRDAARLMLELDQPMATVDLWANGTHQAIRLDAPFEARPVPHHDLVFPLEAGPDETLDLYARVETSLASFGVELWQRDAFHRGDRDEQLAEGAFYGVCAVMLVYNLILYFAVRDRSYLFYVAYLGLFALFYAAYDGYAFQYLWPRAPAWNRGSVDTLVFAASAAFAAFARAFVDTRAHVPRLDRYLAAFIVTALLATGLALARPRGSEAVLTLLSNALPFAGLALSGAAGAMAHRAGSPSARFFLVGFAFFFGGVALIVGGNLGVFPHGAFTQHGVQLGAVAEVATFSLGLANRVNLLRRELASRVRTLEDQKRSIDSLNEELRLQVTERSQKLAEAIARLDGGRNGPAQLAPGQVVEDRYEVVRRIGAGAMGAVYEVRRVSDARALAMKVMGDTVTPLGMLRFAREAQLASEVAHPNVVAVVDVGVAAAGFLFMVMELVHGSSLLEQRARFGDVAWGLGVLADVAFGLEAIHAKGVVHRDLKPANVLVEGEGEGAMAKISDFGVSTVLGEASADMETLEGAAPSSSAPTSGSSRSASSTLTATGVVVGTPIYMAPELAFGAREARPASDVFSFGVLACEVLSGHRPFTRSPALARVRGMDLPAARSFREACPTLAPELAELLDRCLTVEPTGRPSASELARALGATRGRGT